MAVVSVGGDPCDRPRWRGAKSTYAGDHKGPHPTPHHSRPYGSSVAFSLLPPIFAWGDAYEGRSIGCGRDESAPTVCPDDGVHLHNDCNAGMMVFICIMIVMPSRTGHYLVFARLYFRNK
jgi:hypothetical protein